MSWTWLENLEDEPDAESAVDDYKGLEQREPGDCGLHSLLFMNRRQKR